MFFYTVETKRYNPRLTPTDSDRQRHNFKYRSNFAHIVALSVWYRAISNLPVKKIKLLKYRWITGYIFFCSFRCLFTRSLRDIANYSQTIYHLSDYRRCRPSVSDHRFEDTDRENRVSSCPEAMAVGGRHRYARTTILETFLIFTLSRTGAVPYEQCHPEREKKIATISTLRRVNFIASRLSDN